MRQLRSGTRERAARLALLVVGVALVSCGIALFILVGWKVL